MKQGSKANVDVKVKRFEPQTAKSTCLRINLEASFTPVIHNEVQQNSEQQNIYARELASPVLHIAKDYQSTWKASFIAPSNCTQSIPGNGKKVKVKKKCKKKNLNTKRNKYNKVSRSKSVNNNRRKLEKRINFYRVQNICNHFHRQSSGSRRREFNNTPVHKYSHSISEPIQKGVAPVPSKAIKPQDLVESNQNALNTSKNLKCKRKNKLSAVDNQINSEIEIFKDDPRNFMNSNRVVEPFSPTFEHPDDFMSSNHTSFRPEVKSK